MRFICLSVVGLFLSASSLALPLSSAQLKEILRARGAKWEATEARTDRALGAPVESDEIIFSAPSSGKSRLPAKWDWRDQGGVSYMSPQLDQGRCGSCVAFAVIGALETQLNITRKTPTAAWSLSTQHLFSCGGGGCNEGWTPSSAMSFLRTKGVPDETCFPYQSGALGEDVACSKSCADSSTRSLKIASSSSPTVFFANTDAVKKAVMEGPVVAGMTVYEDFMYYKSGVYKHVTGKVAGGHAVYIMGWDDAEKYWIVRNSWGPDWGENGYFRIAWSDASGLGNSTWKMVVPASDKYVLVSGVQDRVAVAGPLDLNIVSTVPDSSLSWKVQKGGAQVLAGDVKPSEKTVVDTKFLKDGVYQVVANAQTKDGMVASPPKTLHVLNSPLTGTISFKNLTSGESIEGTKILDLVVTSAPIPFDRVVFQRTSLLTGEVVVRGTTNVASAMKMSWRTTGIENGLYEVSVTGYAGKQAVSMAPIQVAVSN